MGRSAPKKIGLSRARRWSPLAALLALGACNSVLGIEDLHDGPRPGTGGDDSSGGSQNPTGGKNNPSGGSVSTAGNSPDAGANSATSGAGGNSSGTSGTTGTSGTSGSSGTMNDGGAGGEPPVVGDPTVRGKVIDFWGQAVPNIAVQVGDQTTTTDAAGKFTVQDVPGKYDVSLLVIRESNGKYYGWVYQDLTRRDPTLQVYDGREDREAQTLVKVTMGTADVNDTITTAIGTAQGARENADTTADPVGENMYADWQGATSTVGSAHALMWTNNAATNVPSAYKAYDTKQVALSDGVQGEVDFDLSADVITAKPITGTVMPAGVGDRSNAMFLRFASGAAIQVVKNPTTTDVFSYLAPTIADSSITVAAIEGDDFGGPLSIVHKDGLSPGGATGTLTVAKPALPQAPRAMAVAADKANFSFTPGAGNAGAYVVTIESSNYYESIFVVTSKTSFALPKVLDGALALRPGDPGPPIVNEPYRWWVETHGAFKTVDEMCGPTGFADEFSAPLYGYRPLGPHNQDGSYTFSGYYGFTVKP